MLAAAIPQILALAAMKTATPTVATPVTMAPLWSEIHPPTTFQSGHSQARRRLVHMGHIASSKSMAIRGGELDSDCLRDASLRPSRRSQ